jgi:hypothetical protein
MSDELMERYEAAVRATDESSRDEDQVAQEAAARHIEPTKHPAFWNVHNFRMNRASREAGIAREVIAALRAEHEAQAARVAELEAAAQWRDPETAPVNTLAVVQYKILFGSLLVDVGYTVGHNIWLYRDKPGRICNVVGWQPLPEAALPQNKNADTSE